MPSISWLYLIYEAARPLLVAVPASRLPGRRAAKLPPSDSVISKSGESSLVRVPSLATQESVDVGKVMKPFEGICQGPLVFERQSTSCSGSSPRNQIK